MILNKKLILYYFLVGILFGCDKDNFKNGSESCYKNSEAKDIVHNGINREYILYIPHSYDGTSSIPLVLNFHGFGDSASNYFQNVDMRSVADSNTFILVYPQGTCIDGYSHWNPCPIGGDNKSTVDDLGFIEALINEVSLEYNVDMKRVYAVGYSNGSMMTYGLANYKSNLIAAVASVSGAMLDCKGGTSHPMPVVHFHGTSDGVLPYNGNNVYNSVQSTLNYWINFNNTTTSPTVTSINVGDIKIEHYVYDQGNNSVSVEHYKYIGGGHAWFKETYQGQNTSQLVWSFLSRYDNDGLR